jgi:hypothetical protein
VLVSTMLAPEVNLMLEDGTAWVRDYVPGTEPPAGAVDFRVPLDGLVPAARTEPPAGHELPAPDTRLSP